MFIYIHLLFIIFFVINMNKLRNVIIIVYNIDI